jgi:hypothetical protein
MEQLAGPAGGGGGEEGGGQEGCQRKDPEQGKIFRFLTFSEIFMYRNLAEFSPSIFSELFYLHISSKRQMRTHGRPGPLFTAWAQGVLHDASDNHFHLYVTDDVTNSVIAGN